MPTVADVSTVQYSGDLRVDSLLHLSAGWNYLLPARATLHFTFDLGAIAGDSPQGRPVAEFNDMQQAAARAILAHASALTGVAFAEVASGAQADIHFANCDLDSSGLCRTEWSYAYGADNVLTAYRAEAYVFLDDVQFAASNGSPLPGGAGYEVLLHEIGHALGLDHPFDDPYPLPAELDNTGNTVMSYNHVGGSKTTFQGFDLRALAWIYGGDGLGGLLGLNSARGPLLDDYAAAAATAGGLAVGGTVRGTIEQAGDRDWLAVDLQAGGRYAFELEGATGGAGTLADPLLRLLSPAGAVLASNDNAGGTADALLEFITPASGRYFLEVASAAANGTGTWQLNAGSVLDEVFGTAGDDTLVDPTGGAARLYGLAGNDRLQGGSGDDLLDGGPGIDTALYARGAGSHAVARTGSQWRITDKTGAEGRDTLVSIEKLQFADKSFDLVNLPRQGAPAYGQQNGFLFDAVYYLLDNPELVPTQTLATALSHYFAGGAAQGKQPNSWFDPNYYENRWPDLKAGNFSDDILFMHYNLYGVWEGRSAGPEFDRFDGNRYLRDSPDVAAYVDSHLPDFLGSRSNGAIAHFVIYGQHEMRPAFDLVGQPIDLGYTVDLGA
jgi:Ca2+-binding RTX toxin-like protein